MMTCEESGSCRSLDSSSSQPGPPRSTAASWAVSFERLLQDPAGVCYFTAFLKSEVSAENILFWQECEKFQQIPGHQREELSRAARSIFDNYLSDSAFHAVNIDDTARVTESDLQNPKPDMFQKAQQQIFKLMKFDSYTRFIRSQLFQKCMLAEVELRPLPDIGLRTKNHRAMQNTDRRLDSQNNKAQLGTCSSLETEAERRRGQESRAAWDRGGPQRGAWEAKMSMVSRGPCENSAGKNAQPAQRRGAITLDTAVGLPPVANQMRPNNRARNTAARKTYDMDGFNDMLSRTQWYSVDDQRGLLKKEHLVMPSFLALPPQDKETQDKEAQGENRGSTEPGPTTAPAPPTQSGQERAVSQPASREGNSGAQRHSPLSRPEGSFFCTDLSRETVV